MPTEVRERTVSNRYLKLTGLLVAALTFVGAVGCERGQTQPDSREGTDRSPCTRDPDCSGYLRCIDGTCRVPPAVEGRRDEATPVVTLSPPEESDAQPVEFPVELATSAAERRRGLMYRETLAEGWGMLFVYPDEAPRSFWMKNTYIPLDMIFIDAEGRVVNVVESAEPETLTGRPSEGPARFVLEVNAGVAASTGIEAGWQMSVDNVPDEHVPGR